jgi:hypothetical protein
MDKYKELLIEVVELHLRGKGIMDSDSYNTLLEYAPLIAEEMTKAFRVDRKEFREIIKYKDKGISIIDIKHKIFNCRFQ